MIGMKQAEPTNCPMPLTPTTIAMLFKSPMISFIKMLYTPDVAIEANNAQNN